jgi:ribosome-associated protein
MKKNDLKQQVAAAINACLDKKAEELTILEMEKGSGAFTDYFVLCSGTNPRQVQAIADARRRPFRRPMSRVTTRASGY